MPKTWCSLSAQTLLELSRVKGGVALPQVSDWPCSLTVSVGPCGAAPSSFFAMPILLIITFHIALAVLVGVTQLQHVMCVLEVCLFFFFPRMVLKIAKFCF